VDVTGGSGGGNFSNYGWFDGTKTTLGDSHNLAGGDFFKFHLAQDSFVSITFSENSAAGLLNPAFSVYRGLLPDEAHDDAGFDPLNPMGANPNPPPPFIKVASPIDTGTTNSCGSISPFRNTANITFVGQFDADGSWSMANASGTCANWAVIKYMTHVPPQGGTSVSLLSYLLPAGDYTIAAAGGNNCNPGCVITNIPGTITFSASPAPDGDGDGRADGLDNCPVTSNPTQANGDADPRGDACDNCRLVANTGQAGTGPSQNDFDNDGYGNICDADLNNSGLTTSADYNLLRNALNTTNGNADMNGSGLVTSADYNLLRNRLNTAPGPSGLSCAIIPPTPPCPSP
jgi:hypothetical protein